jgi:hypothetical protein
MFWRISDEKALAHYRKMITPGHKHFNAKAYFDHIVMEDLFGKPKPPPPKRPIPPYLRIVK